MTDQADLQAQLLATLQAQQAQLASMHPQTPAASPWASAAQTPSVPPIAGVAVPVKFQTPIGSIRVYISLPAEYGATPDTLMNALETLAAADWPLDAWSGRDSSRNGGSWGGGGNRSGYSNSRNNWRR